MFVFVFSISRSQFSWFHWCCCLLFIILFFTAVSVLFWWLLSVHIINVFAMLSVHLFRSRNQKQMLASLATLIGNFYTIGFQHVDWLSIVYKRTWRLAYTHRIMYTRSGCNNLGFGCLKDCLLPCVHVEQLRPSRQGLLSVSQPPGNKIGARALCCSG